MLDPETFMKNSPFQVANNISYNLSNTTPDLLKFQLQEQARAQVDPSHTLEPLFVELSFNTHLQTILHDNNFSFDEDTDGNDDFLQTGQSSGLSTPSSMISDSWKVVARLTDRNYSNMRVLIENSVFDTAKISPKAVLSLSQLKSLKQKIAEKTELKEYLEQKCSLSNQFCSTLLSSSDSTLSELDALLLVKVLKQISDLQLRLMQVSQELDEHNVQLKNHNLVCLISGYIEDVKYSNMSKGNDFDVDQKPQSRGDTLSTRAFEALFSHIASLAAQKSVSLPEFPSTSDAGSLPEQISWALDCIDALSAIPSVPSSAASQDPEDTGIEDMSVVKEHSFLSASPYKAYKEAATLDKKLSEYKLALDDLKFSQEYFAKEYDYLKENSLKTILEYRKKNTYLEKELNRLQSMLPTSHQSSSLDSLKSKDQEIFKLRRELNSLRIDVMGNKSTALSSTINTSLLSSLDGNDQEDHTLNPASSPTNLKSMSTAILRKEFKKIVEDIQDQYELELEEERAKRRQLELQLQQSTAV